MAGKSTYAEQTLRCPNCITIQKHYMWSDGGTVVCDHGGCGTVLNASNIVKPKKKKVPGIRTDTKNRV